MTATYYPPGYYPPGYYPPGYFGAAAQAPPPAGPATFRLFPKVGALGTPAGRRALLSPAFSVGGVTPPPSPATFRLFPKVGSLGTAAGRRAVLLPPFSLAVAVPPAGTLAEAVKLQLRAWNGGALPALLGEAPGAAPADQKIQSEQTLNAPGLPWVWVEQPTGQRRYASFGNYIESGELTVAIFETPKLAAELLGRQVAAALNDAPLVWASERLMAFRLKRAGVPGANAPALSASPVNHNYFLSFSFMYSGQI